MCPDNLGFGYTRKSGTGCWARTGRRGYGRARKTEQHLCVIGTALCLLEEAVCFNERFTRDNFYPAPKVNDREDIESDVFRSVRHNPHYRADPLGAA